MSAKTDLLRAMFDAAVAAAQPDMVLAAHLPEPPKGRVVVVGAGKASAAMARALERAWHIPLTGLVITPYGHSVACQHIEIAEAAHPVPDENGRAAARRILALAGKLVAGDLMIALISGGGSSLLTLPAPGLALSDKQAVNTALLRSGATITQMNTVRKHLSAIKGGRLAVAAWPAHVLTLAISDVPGDDPSVIASGPTVADDTTLADARKILGPLLGTLPPAVARALHDETNETPFSTTSRLANSRYQMIATPQMSLDAAARVATTNNVPHVILGDAIEGEARDIGADMADLALRIQSGTHTITPPCVLISGGETTVTLREGGPFGRGGRNAEFLLGLAQRLNNQPGIYAIACDTDGIDGADKVAGAIVTPDTVARGDALGYSVSKALGQHDGHGYFGLLEDAVITGPTRTNVNDFRAILILKQRQDG